MSCESSGTTGAGAAVRLIDSGTGIAFSISVGVWRRIAASSTGDDTRSGARGKALAGFLASLPLAVGVLGLAVPLFFGFFFTMS
jgi:hypothetical protein